MPNPPPSLDTHALLTAVCDDAIFLITGSGRFEVDTLRALSHRRTQVLTAAARGSKAVSFDTWESWIFGLCAASAPVAPPRWVPMSDAIAAGLSLQHGARGVRSLFTSKPSEKDVARVRSQGAAAARALGAVLGSTGTFTAESKLLRDAFVASLGLPEDDQRLLQNESPLEAESLDMHGDFDSKVARAIVRGAFFAAMSDGLDPREEQAVSAIARKLGQSVDEVNSARNDARAMLDGAKQLGEASVETVRYLFSDDTAEGDKIGAAVARLSLPLVLRREALTAINVGGPVTLGKKFKVDKRERETILGLLWITAARANPSYTRRAILAARHDRVAIDLGDVSLGAEIRATADRFLETELTTTLDAAAV